MGWQDDPEVKAEGSPRWAADPEVAPSEEGPGKTESAALGAIQGLNPFEDEMAGVGGALADKLLGKPGTLAESYRSHRDATRAGNAAAEAAHSTAYHGGEFGGALATMFVPGAGEVTAARGLGVATAKGAAMGAFQGLGSSEADLTRGDVAGAAKDTGIGALVGGAAGAVGHGLGKAVEWVGDRAAAGIRGAEADAGALEWANAQKAYRAARSAVGGEAAAGLNAVDQAEKIVANQSGHYTPALVSEAGAWLATPEVAALRQRAAGNVLEAGQNRLPGSLATAEAVFRQAQQRLTPQAVEAGAADRLADPIGRQILPRVKNYAARAIPPIIGAAVGGPVGAALGFGAGAVMGNPGTSLANALKSPAVRKMAWALVESGSSALGRFGPYLQRAITSLGVQGAQELHERLLDSSPDYQQKVTRALENDPQVEPAPEGP